MKVSKRVRKHYGTVLRASRNSGGAGGDGTSLVLRVRVDDGDALHLALVGEEVCDRVMLARPVVPEGDGVLLPVEAALVLRVGAVLEEELLQMFHWTCRVATPFPQNAGPQLAPKYVG